MFAESTGLVLGLSELAVKMQTQMKFCQPVHVTRERVDGGFSQQPSVWKLDLSLVYLQWSRLIVLLFYWPCLCLCSSSMSPKNKQAFIAQIPGSLHKAKQQVFANATLLLGPQGMCVSTLLACLYMMPIWSEALSAVPWTQTLLFNWSIVKKCFPYPFNFDFPPSE